MDQGAASMAAQGNAGQEEALLQFKENLKSEMTEMVRRELRAQLSPPRPDNAAVDREAEVRHREVMERIYRMELETQRMGEELKAQREIMEAQRELMEARFTAADKRFEQLQVQMDRRFEAVEKRFEAVDKRFETVDKRFETVDKRFEELRADMNHRFNLMTALLLILVPAATTALGWVVEILG